MARGFVPTLEIARNPEMLYIAIGILGATVMPHNLYLHSSLVQTRSSPDSNESRKDAIHLHDRLDDRAHVGALRQRGDPHRGGRRVSRHGVR